jgi:preprotein translocase subunit SecA
VVAEVDAAHDAGRPVLLGTLDVAESERLAARLVLAGLPCVVLNAKNDAEEAAIVAEAGAAGAITVSTQMAGRGTDIRLGGTSGDHGEVAGLGGLLVIGVGRHASSRLDDQLRGRAGRQGDPGGSVFFLSMEDELIITCAPDDAKAHWTVGHAQRVAEGTALQIHRDTWRYNVLIEDQRRAVLEYREQVLHSGAALRELETSSPDRVAELRDAGVPDEVLIQAARQISLSCLDQAWAEHLAQAAGLREGIHLRALGHSSNPFGGPLIPVQEFNRELTELFSRFTAEVSERAAAAFQAAEITADGADLAGAGLKRPSATWTYVVQENPFGTDFGRAVQAISRFLGRR